MSKIQFTAVAIVASVLTGVLGFTLFKRPGDCAQARAGIPTQESADADVELDLGLEIAGNTPEWQEEVATFLRGQFDRIPHTVDGHPARVFVALSTFKGAKEFELTSGCGVDRFVVGPNSASLDEWLSGDGGYRKTLESDFEALRSRQIDAIVDSVVTEVASTAFNERERTAFPMSPAPVLQSVSADSSTSKVHWAAVLIAGASSVGDCMDPQEALNRLPENPAPSDLAPVASKVVAGCVQFGQLDLVAADDLLIAPARVANPSAMQKAWANALANAVCEHAVSPRTTCTSQPL